MKPIIIILLFLSFGLVSFAQSNPVIRMRCFATVSDHHPLWIIKIKKKSYILNHQSVSLINPDAIEHLEVMKDIPSMALYGSRGANGVILITILPKEARREYKRLKPYLEK